VNTVEDIRRKLRGIVALLEDSAASDAERANAEALKARLEKRLAHESAPACDWTDAVFRFGRRFQKVAKSTVPPSQVSSPSKIGFRLGRAVGQGLRKWRSSE